MTDRIKIVIEDEAWTQIDGYNDWISRLDGLLQESINKYNKETIKQSLQFIP